MSVHVVRRTPAGAQEGTCHCVCALLTTTALVAAASLLPVTARAQQPGAVERVLTETLTNQTDVPGAVPIPPVIPPTSPTQDVATEVVPNLTAIIRDGGLNGNQQQIASALTNFINGGGKLPPQFANLLPLTGSDLTKALTSLTGEVVTGAQLATFQLTRQFFTIMADPFIDGRSDIAAIPFAPERSAMPQDAARAYASVLKAAPVDVREPRWGVWASAFGGYNQTSGDAAAGSNDLTARLFGFAGGLDYQLSRDTVVGVALAGGHTNWGLAEGLGGGRGDAVLAGIHAATRWGPSYLAARFAYSWHSVSTDRFAAGDHLTADFNAQSLAARVEGGWNIAFAHSSVAPYGAVQAQSVRTPAYSETDGGGGFALAYQARTATDVRSELGARFEHRIMLDNNARLTLGARAAWAHDWASDPSLTATFQALSTVSFTVNGATPPKDSALGLIGAELRLPNGVTLSGKVDGEFASGATTWGGTGRIRLLW